MINYSLFFTDYHDALIATLRNLLAKGGKVIIAAPERGTTMKRFLEKATEFEISIDDCERFKALVAEKII